MQAQLKVKRIGFGEGEGIGWLFTEGTVVTITEVLDDGRMIGKTYSKKSILLKRDEITLLAN